MVRPVSFRWDDEFVARVDEARGDVPRSRWIQRVLDQYMEQRRVITESFELNPDFTPKEASDGTQA